MVLLKAFSVEGFKIFTNLSSRKGKELVRESVLLFSVREGWWQWYPEASCPFIPLDSWLLTMMLLSLSSSSSLPSFVLRFLSCLLYSTFFSWSLFSFQIIPHLGVCSCVVVVFITLVSHKEEEGCETREGKGKEKERMSNQYREKHFSLYPVSCLSCSFFLIRIPTMLMLVSLSLILMAFTLDLNTLSSFFFISSFCPSFFLSSLIPSSVKKRSVYMFKLRFYFLSSTLSCFISVLFPFLLI